MLEIMSHCGCDDAIPFPPDESTDEKQNCDTIGQWGMKNW
jgi:hypothetical protein